MWPVWRNGCWQWLDWGRDALCRPALIQVLPVMRIRPLTFSDGLFSGGRLKTVWPDILQEGLFFNFFGFFQQLFRQGDAQRGGVFFAEVEVELVEFFRRHIARFAAFQNGCG